jgi:hypothetical protein
MGTSGTTKQAILEQITDFYLSSGDFNGLPGITLTKRFGSNTLLRSLIELIEEDKASVVFGNVHPNPHIRALPDIPKEEQIRKLQARELSAACVYPLEKYLQEVIDRSEYENRPYILALALGSPQLDFKAFDLSVLEFYRNDPRYIYENNDIRGLISISDEYFESESVPESDQVLLDSFGFCYDDALNRAVAVFVRYLADLSPEHQQIWKAKELQGEYKLHSDYYRNSILGDWGEGISIFDAFVEELQLINKMAETMGHPALFKNDFRDGKPRKFGFLVRPTLESYNEFVLLLDKMISDNINKKFFRNQVPSEKEVERKDGKIEIRQVGTLNMLESWIRKYFRTDDWAPVDEMIESFKEVRKKRQKPAHAVDENAFDQTYFHDQRRLIMCAYTGVRTLRMMLENHPRVRVSDIEMHPVLREGKIWDR